MKGVRPARRECHPPRRPPRRPGQPGQGRACVIETDERGQGVGYSEAMNALAKAVAEWEALSNEYETTAGMLQDRSSRDQAGTRRVDCRANECSVPEHRRASHLVRIVPVR